MFDRKNKVARSAAKMWRRGPPSAAATRGDHRRPVAYDSLPSTESSDPIPATETATSTATTAASAATRTATATAATAEAGGPRTSRRRRRTAWDTRKTCVRLLGAACIVGGVIPVVVLDVTLGYMLAILPYVVCAAIPFAWDVAVSTTTCIRRRSNGFWHPGGHIATDVLALGFNLALLLSAGPLVQRYDGTGINIVAYAAPALALLVASGVLRVTLIVISCVEVYMLRRDAASVVESLRRQGWDIDPDHLRKKKKDDDESSAAGAAAGAAVALPAGAAEAAGKPVIPIQELHHDAAAAAELPQSSAKTPELMGDGDNDAAELPQSSAKTPELMGDSAAVKAELDGAGGGWRPQAAGEYAELGG